MENIQMVDLKNQYFKIKNEIINEVQKVFEQCDFINGKKVDEFADNLKHYMGTKYVIPCANGTDAIQIALMALDLRPGDEIIVPAFTYVATAEVIGLLGLTPVLVDVDPNSFCLTAQNVEAAISNKTKAIVPVHLYGQSCDMYPIMKLAKKYNLFVIEDNAQAIGSSYIFPDGTSKKTGTIGDIGCTSFFPSKNLGCYGDGGAIFTDDAHLAKRIKMIANHGQNIKYKHDIIGCNSRLDTLQAAILDVKLKYLDIYIKNRYLSASYYTNHLNKLFGYIQTPTEQLFSTHVYHQYTIKVLENKRNLLKNHLEAYNIPSMIYYPIPLDQQNAFKSIIKIGDSLSNSHSLTNEVLSLPIHTELTPNQQEYIIEKIYSFFNV